MTTVPLCASSTGYLVPRGDFASVVHSVFARAVNLDCATGLLALLVSPAGNGPTSIVLGPGAPDDLRRLFVPGEALHARRGVLRSPRAVVQLAGARRDQRAPRRPLLPLAERDTRRRTARTQLARARRTRPSVIDGAAAPAIAALVCATRAPASDVPGVLVERLVGWGEGLTPACDDFLVGYLSGLERLALDAPRARFLAGLRAAVLALAGRTTVFGAHFLRLAVRGHYATALARLRDALLCEPRADVVPAALTAAVEIGATSGADAVSGLLAALEAWCVNEPDRQPT